MVVNVEIKNAPQDQGWDPAEAVAALTAAAIDEAGWTERVIVSSFQPATLLAVQAADGRLALGALWGFAADPGPALAEAVAAGFRAVHPFVTVVTPELVAEAHAAGLAVNVWTVNAPMTCGRWWIWGWTRSSPTGSVPRSPPPAAADGAEARPRAEKGLSPGRMAGDRPGPQRWSAMNVVVCVKQIPDPAAPASARRRHQHPRPVRQAHPRRLGQLRRRDGPPAGRAAGGGEVTLVSMAPAARRPGLRTGARHGRGQGHPGQRRCRWPGSDALGTAKVLAAAIRRAHPDLVAAWPPSPPTATPAPCPVQVAELLGLPSVTFAKVDRRRRWLGQGRAADRGGLRRGGLPLAGGGHGHSRRRRAPLPLVQGHHGGQVQAGRQPDGRRPRHRRRRRWAPQAPAR